MKVRPPRNPQDPHQVADWLTRSVYELMVPRRVLWARRTIDGIGWMLTEGPPPKSAGWELVTSCDSELAEGIHGKNTGRNWTKLLPIISAIDDVLARWR